MEINTELMIYVLCPIDLRYTVLVQQKNVDFSMHRTIVNVF